MSSTVLLISSFFESPSPGGGIVLSRSVVSEWLKRQHTVHVIGADFGSSAGKNLGAPLQEAIAKGQLHIHNLVPTSALEYPHRLDEGLYQRTFDLVQSIRPSEIHIHNFHGLLSCVQACAENHENVIYTVLDFGLACHNFYLLNNEGKSCSGPEGTKCHECLYKSQEMGLRFLPKHLKALVSGVFSRKPNLRQHLRPFKPTQRRYLRETGQHLSVMLPLFKKFKRVFTASPPAFDLVKKYRGTDLGVYSNLFPVAQDRISEKTGDPCSGPLRLLFLGHSENIKGGPFLLKVLESLPDGLDLEVIDGGGALGALVQNYPAARRYLHFSEKISSGLVATKIQESDGCLLPSLWAENTPLVVLESLANGRPVFASHQPGIAHLIEEGKNGFLVPPGDLPAWREAFISWSKNVKTVREMRQNCHYKKAVTEYVGQLEKDTFL